jgi:hypothetical protein
VSVVEDDLRLSLDDQVETPLPGASGGVWAAGTPVRVYETEAHLRQPQADEYTPTSSVGCIGSGKSLILASYVTGFCSAVESTAEGWPFWSRVSRYVDLANWWGVGTPTDPDPSGRTRFLVLIRKLHSATTKREVEENAVIRAVRDLCEWLQITQAEAALTAGLSERTFYYWQANPSVQPRLRSVEQLSRVHAFVEGMVHDFGEDQTRAWMREGSPSRLVRLRDADALHAIEDEALEAMRQQAVQTTVGLRRAPRGDARRDDADLFAARERIVPEPLQLIVVTRDREDDRE